MFMAITDELSQRDLARLRAITLKIHYQYFPQDASKRVKDYSQVDMLINTLSEDACYQMIKRQVDKYEDR